MLILNPPPVRVGARTPTDTDPILVDFTLNLTPLNDTIESVIGAVASRVDGVAVGSGDLTVTAFTVLNSLQVLVGLSGGLSGVSYYITITIGRTSGPQVSRTVVLQVTNLVG